MLKNWIEKNTGLQDSIVFSLKIDNQDYIYAGTNNTEEGIEDEVDIDIRGNSRDRNNNNWLYVQLDTVRGQHGKKYWVF